MSNDSATGRPTYSSYSLQLPSHDVLLVNFFVAKLPWQWNFPLQYALSVVVVLSSASSPPLVIQEPSDRYQLPAIGTLYMQRWHLIDATSPIMTLHMPIFPLFTCPSIDTIAQGQSKAYRGAPSLCKWWISKMTWYALFSGRFALGWKLNRLNPLINNYNV